MDLTGGVCSVEQGLSLDVVQEAGPSRDWPSCSSPGEAGGRKATGFRETILMSVKKHQL